VFSTLNDAGLTSDGELGNGILITVDDENPADLIQLDPGNLLARRDKRPLLLYLSVAIEPVVHSRFRDTKC
jgi:hypothetical protein